MSKQSDAKKTQAYRAKAIPRNCGNCCSFRCDRANANEKIMGKTGVSVYMTDVNLHCAIGGFPVKKAGVCDLFVMKSLDKVTQEIQS